MESLLSLLTVDEHTIRDVDHLQHKGLFFLVATVQPLALDLVVEVRDLELHVLEAPLRVGASRGLPSRP